MPKFLSKDELYRVLQRESPEDVLADGPPSAFFTTADNYSFAKCVETSYDNLSLIYDNYFPQYAEDKLDDWEITVFGKVSAGLTTSQRQDRILTKLRSRRGVSKSDIVAAVQTVIGSDKLVEVAGWGDKNGGWMIGESQLGVTTYLNGYRMVDAVGPDLCDLGPSDFGLTSEDWAGMQEQAYTYSVLIYGYTPTTDELAELETVLSASELARDQHFIYSGLDPADMISGDT